MLYHIFLRKKNKKEALDIQIAHSSLRLCASARGSFRDKLTRMMTYTMHIAIYLLTSLLAFSGRGSW
jgi:hypothetical protein